MITEDQLLPFFLQTCPSLVHGFNQRQERWAGDGGPYPCIELGHFANHFVELKQQDQTQELKAGFGLLERLYIEGDASVQKTITLCFLEDFVVQTEICHLDPQGFASYFGPVSRKHWEEMRRWWSGESPIVQAETGAT